MKDHMCDCQCFDCRMRRKIAAEEAVEAQLYEDRIERDRQGYIRRRGGEPYVPNKKPSQL